MLTTKQTFIPLLTTNAGLCLTLANWQEVEVSTASYSLEHLLYKPGLELLKKIENPKAYLACPGDMVLNATSLMANREGYFILKSPYDGSKIKCFLMDVIELIHHLKPNAVILPKNILEDVPEIWTHWHDSIMPFLHPEDLKNQPIEKDYGVYFNAVDQVDWNQLEQWAHKPRYLMGQFEPELIHSLSTKGIEWVETDEPAQAALQGLVYTQTGSINLANSETSLQFEPIEEHCACPTCAQGFTKAYLHHLFHHTPLLCQRLLIQHNLYCTIHVDSLLHSS